MKTLDLDNIDLEKQMLMESVVGAVGLSSDQIQIGLKGDPSLRETAMDRCRYESEIDQVFKKLEPILEDLLINRGIYRLFIGFNNSEIRTNSIFDPLREEIHEASTLTSVAYVNRHFPPISYDDKVEVMREIYQNLMGSGLFQKMPSVWQNITTKRHSNWEPMTIEQIKHIISTLKVMRNMPEYYLRNFTLSIVQSVVRMQFNCDGTQIVTAKNFKEFIETNLP